MYIKRSKDEEKKHFNFMFSQESGLSVVSLVAPMMADLTTRQPCICAMY